MKAPPKLYRPKANRNERHGIGTYRWQQLRLKALARDNWQCQRCSTIEVAEHVHHIQSRHARPDLAFEIENLESLCAKCHRMEHGEMVECLHGNDSVTCPQCGGP